MTWTGGLNAPSANMHVSPNQRSNQYSLMPFQGRCSEGSQQAEGMGRQKLREVLTQNLACGTEGSHSTPGLGQPPRAALQGRQETVLQQALI